MISWAFRLILGLHVCLDDHVLAVSGDYVPKVPGSACWGNSPKIAQVDKRKIITVVTNSRGGVQGYNNCEMKFIVEKGNRIAYIFVSDFTIHESPGCKQDFVSLRDNENERILLGKYCAESQLPRVVRKTVGHMLILKFHRLSGLYSKFSLQYWAVAPTKRCSATMYQGLKWPKGLAGEVVTISCSRGSASWFCGRDGNYEKRGPKLDDGCKALQHENTVLEETFNNMTSVAKEGGSSEDLLMKMMTIAEKMLSPEMKDTWSELSFEKKNDLMQDITNAIEQSAVKIALTEAENKTLTMQAGRLVVHVQTLVPGEHQNVTFDSDDTPEDGPSVHMDFDLPNGTKADEQMSAVIIVYRDMSETINLNASGSGMDDMKFENNFLAVSVYNTVSSTRLNVTDQIVMSYTMPKTIPGDIDDRRCAFWDEQKLVWSTEGCHLTQATSSQTTCECDHLTFFAVLVDVSGASEYRKVGENIPENTEKSLVLLTYIGCGLSVVCLFMSIVCFYILRSLWCQRVTIHRNLCINLLIGQVLFVAAVDDTEEKVSCAVIAGLLHFFFLASFSWMCLEGVQLYLMLVKVLTLKHKRIVWFYLSGYGVPALIVTISAVIYPGGYGTNTYCWLKHNHGFIWSFTGPVLLVMLINIVFLIKTLRVIYKVGHGKIRTSHPQTYVQCFRRAARGAVLLQCILGTTWIVGYAYQGPSTIAFAYLFTILNSTQGVFIFIFYVATNETVLKAIREKLRSIQRITFGKGTSLETGFTNSGSSPSHLSAKQCWVKPDTTSESNDFKARSSYAQVAPVARPASVNLSVCSLPPEREMQMPAFLEVDGSSSPTLAVSGCGYSVMNAIQNVEGFNEEVPVRNAAKKDKPAEVSKKKGRRITPKPKDGSDTNVTLVRIIKI